MDMGVIRAWKVSDRRLILREILKDIYYRIERRDANKNRTRGLNGLHEGYDPNLFDVYDISKRAWELVSSQSIARCWLKARCLPCVYESDLRQQWSRTSKERYEDDISDIMKSLQMMSLEGLQMNCEESASDTVYAWVNVEESNHGRFVLISSLIDDEVNNSSLYNSLYVLP